MATFYGATSTREDPTFGRRQASNAFRMRTLSGVLLGLLLAISVQSASAQPAPAAGSTVADVRATLTAARAEIDAYSKAGGKSGVADHPAVKWHATLWTYRERNPGSDAAALATAEAIQLLIRAELSDAAHAKADSIGMDDRAWVRLSALLYYEASGRQDFSYAVRKLSEIAAGSPDATIKSAALVALGRAQRRQGDIALAVSTFESARAAAPESASAIEANAILYDIAHLSIGLQAPAFSGATRDGRVISLESLRGSAVVMVFWGST